MDIVFSFVQTIHETVKILFSWDNCSMRISFWEKCGTNGSAFEYLSGIKAQ